MNKILTTFIMVSFVLNTTAFACPKLVKEGESSPCTGIVFTEDQERKIRTDLVYYKELSERYEKRSELDKQLLELERATSKDLRTELNARDNSVFWEKTLFFMLGAGLTGLASYVAIQSTSK